MPKNSNAKKMGRPTVDPQFKKFRVTVSLETVADASWSALAKAAGCSKGHIAAWFSHSPEAADARRVAVKNARHWKV